MRVISHMSGEKLAMQCGQSPTGMRVSMRKSSLYWSIKDKRKAVKDSLYESKKFQAETLLEFLKLLCHEKYSCSLFAAAFCT